MAKLKPYKYTNRYMDSPEMLWSKAEDYFKTIDAVNKEPGVRLPYSHKGLAKFLMIKYSTWQFNQECLTAYSDFVEVLNRINIKIHADQIEGALMNIYPESLLDETYWKWHEAREEKLTIK